MRGTDGAAKSPLPLRILRALFICLLTLVLFVGAGLGVLTALEYRPADEEAAERGGPATQTAGSSEGADAAAESSQTLQSGDSFTIATWNIGYGALGDNADFFMDGGSMVNTADKMRVMKNLDGIAEALEAIAPDIVFLQEVDRNSKRSHQLEELRFLMGDRADPTFAARTPNYAFAYNFRAPFIPYPIPPIGKVNSGILTLSAFPITQATRIQLPCPFSWPLRIANLKRCLLVARIPLADSDRELVLINLHLEAYDDGEGKIAQTKQLAKLLQAEASAGNYVIAGGDFNQSFSSVDTSAYPKLPDMWECGLIDTEAFGDGFLFVMDERTPSCRSLDRPLADAAERDPAHFQYYLIDGFIVSDNLTVESYETLDLKFRDTDHNPVVMRLRLEHSF